jgi:hypothetical protein
MLHRFNLRLLFAVVVVIGVVCAIASSLYRDSERRRMARSNIGRIAKLFLDVEGPGIDLRECRTLTPSALADVQYLADMKVIWLQRSSLDDKGVEELAKCSQLLYVNVEETHVSKEAVANLRKCLPKARVDASD